ncbi:hypothetical protein NUU61_006299 [Penicillium alfredii]|uniref:BIR-domain-containing protein n=1 Tax=Penicillium alfredii TaxID=1506179 RepID=A0A9W9F0L8_9EURO|nr:uncharacterized protein NUU61_006299 [Penicillium alfredii]KAJ5091429.1 hypothetical protein NUU61_006299 [Penicillium alfredii]
MGSEMDTFVARLASFDIVIKPEKRRSSSAKSSKPIGWPHQSPSPAELAHAGFYYKPYETNPDNTTCFQCHRALDGWEEEDSPIAEHLKHSPDCGWAIMMDIQQRSSNPAAIEDPTSDRITQARLATFGSAWPHDGKKGWVCQSEKMVESGWYFCPNEESNDLASCAYCKLSLDGWEPKDDPFDEHYRRSSDCSFFAFAKPPSKKGKGSRTKKPRTSKASSRLSTQSVGTVTSEAPEMGVDESMDQSILSQSTTKSKATKTSKGKGKSAKSKKDVPTEAESQIDVETADLAQPEPSKPKRTGRGKKRTSDQINNDEPGTIVQAETDTTEPPTEPPAKRRATRTRSSSISRTLNYEPDDYAMPDAAPADEAPQDEAKKSRKSSKKGASKARKASDASMTSKYTKAQGPRDSEIDAALEAELEADIPEPSEQEPEPTQPRTSKKTKSSKNSKAVAKAEQPPPYLDQDLGDREEKVKPHMEPEPVEPAGMEEPDVPLTKAKATKASKKKGNKKTKGNETKAEEQETQQSPEPRPTVDDGADNEHHESFVSVEIINREPEPAPKPEAEPASKVTSKKSSKKKDAPADKPKKSKKADMKEQQVAPAQQVDDHKDTESLPEDEGFATPEDMPDQVDMIEAPREQTPERHAHRRPSQLPPKTAKRYSDIPQEEHLAESLIGSQRSHEDEQHEIRRASGQSNRPVSPLPVVHQTTPSLSPQSSDAENRPPSSRPSTSRMPAPSASKEQRNRTPLAVSTPSPSKRNANGGLGASRPAWTPVDIDEALFGEASDKENADLSGMFKGFQGSLTSPEKKMTVEEWITWNAKNGEERLKRECERLVSQFEKEGGRAMRRLEAIDCMD